MASETFGGLDATLASARVPPRGGLLHEGGDLLAGGCAYCTSPRPPFSTPDARAVAPHPRGVGTGRRAGSSPWCFGGEVGRVGRRRVRTLCLAFGGSGYEPATYPTNARPLTQGRARRPGLSSSGVVRTARSSGKPPISVSDVMTSETLRSEETARCNETTR